MRFFGLFSPAFQNFVHAPPHLGHLYDGHFFITRWQPLMVDSMKFPRTPIPIAHSFQIGSLLFPPRVLRRSAVRSELGFMKPSVLEDIYDHAGMLAEIHFFFGIVVWILLNPYPRKAPVFGVQIYKRSRFQPNSSDGRCRNGHDGFHVGGGSFRCQEGQPNANQHADKQNAHVLLIGK